MTPRVEASDQEVRVLAHVRGAGLNFTENRRTILGVFLAATEPVTITDVWLRAKKADHRTSHRGETAKSPMRVRTGTPGNLAGRRRPSLWTGEDRMHARARGVQGLRRRDCERLLGRLKQHLRGCVHANLT
jgi:hypothetical protein